MNKDLVVVCSRQASKALSKRQRVERAGWSQSCHAFLLNPNKIKLESVTKLQ